MATNSLAHRRASAVHAPIIAALAIVLASCTNPALRTDSRVATRTKIEGVYALQEWHLGGQAVRPPLVDGRFVLANGTVIFVVHNRSDGANPVTIASYGKYTLDAQRLAYRYDEWAVFEQASSVITAYRNPPWEGMREFSVTASDGGVRLRSANGQQEFWFGADGVATYTEDGKVLRIYKRVTETP